MALKTTVTCEECGIERREVNHWFLIVMDDLQFDRVVRHKFKMSLMPWDDEVAKREGVSHYCGAEHALKKVSEFLGAQR